MDTQHHLNNKMLVFTFITILAIILFFLIAAVPTVKVHSESPPVVQNTSTDPLHNILAQSNSINGSGKIVYGKSGLGKNLICYKISPVSPVKGKILMTYEIHGFEDDYPRDGQVLVAMGNSLIDYFSKNRTLLGGYELYIVPSANPDGLSNGTTQDGKGRCQISLG